MKRVIMVLSIIIYALFAYWMIVISVATSYNKKGNKYGWEGLAYKCIDQNKSDSFLVLRDHYWEKSDNTIKLLPKFLRP
jgi:hypothetical protein